MIEPIQGFRAEWIKVVGHRRATGLLLWIFPATGLVVTGLFAITALFDPGTHEFARGMFGDWTDLMLLAWTILGDHFGRVLLMGFTAFIFAGEYQWGTWKNLIPRRRRAALILIKLGTLSALVIVAFASLSMILALGGAAVSWIIGSAYAPTLSGTAISQFVPDYALAGVLAFTAFLISALLAAFAAVVSRSILGGTLGGILLIFLEPILLIMPRWLADTLDSSAVLDLARVLPSYNLENIRSWHATDQSTAMLARAYQGFERAPPVDGVGFSVLVLSAWVALGTAALIMAFERQDISS